MRVLMRFSLEIPLIAGCYHVLIGAGDSAVVGIVLPQLVHEILACDERMRVRVVVEEDACRAQVCFIFFLYTQDDFLQLDQAKLVLLERLTGTPVYRCAHQWQMWKRLWRTGALYEIDHQSIIVFHRKRLGDAYWHTRPAGATTTVGRHAVAGAT